MSIEDVAYAAPTADELAWEATRSGLAVLEHEHRRWFEDLAKWLFERWPDDTPALDVPGADEVDDLRMKLVDAEVRLNTTAVALHLNEAALEDAELIEGEIAEVLGRERNEGHKDALVPSRQDARSKGLRLLIEGRLIVTRYDRFGQHDGLIVATCRGDSGAVYDLGYDPHSKQWRCTCQEMRGNCSHLHALKMVTAVTS